MLGWRTDDGALRPIAFIRGFCKRINLTGVGCSSINRDLSIRSQDPASFLFGSVNRHKYGNDLAGLQPARPMMKCLQQRPRDSAVAREADVGVLLAPVAEEVVEQLERPRVPHCRRLPDIGRPQFIDFGKLGLDSVIRVVLAYPGLAAAFVAGVDADGLAQVLLDDRLEWSDSGFGVRVALWRFAFAADAEDSVEGEARGLEASGEGAYVEGLGSGHVLQVWIQLLQPKVVDHLGLLAAQGGELRVCPVGGGVAGLFRPVVLSSVQSSNQSWVRLSSTELGSKCSIGEVG